MELAFVAAVQYLPANQRAALIMFDVLGFSAGEIADAMDTTATSVNSALQRARKLVSQRVPERSQRATLAALGDDGQRKLVARYTAALQHHDVDGMLALLTEDATWSMPPIPTWFRAHEAIAAFCADAPFRYRWRSRPARANGQLAVGSYWRVETAGAYVARLVAPQRSGGRSSAACWCRGRAGSGCSSSTCRWGRCWPGWCWLACRPTRCVRDEPGPTSAGP